MSAELATEEIMLVLASVVLVIGAESMGRVRDALARRRRSRHEQ